MKRPADEIIKELESLSEQKQEEVIRMIEEAKKTPAKVEKRPALFDTEILDPELDRAERHALAREIAHRIATTETIHTFSINGQWGIGKTVFMDWIRDALETREGGSALVVPFNVWKFERSGNIVYPLLKELRKKAKGKWNQLKVLWISKKVLFTVGTVFGAGLLTKRIEWKEAKQISNRLLDLRALFERWVELVLASQKDPKPKKVVFLIDELDRCTPESVRSILESIKNFLRTKNTCFVLGIDKEIVAKAIASKYESLTGEDGHEYLEKIVEFSYELPFRAEYVWMNLFQDFRKEYEYLRPVELKYVSKFFDFAGVTSLRKIKKILTRFAHVMGEFKRYGIGVSAEVLFFIIFLYEVYPDFLELIKGDTALLEQTALLTIDEVRSKGSQSADVQRIIEFAQTHKIREIVTELINNVSQRPPNRTLADEVKVCIDSLARIGA